MPFRVILKNKAQQFGGIVKGSLVIFTMLLAAFCGWAAFITGLIAIILSRERTIFVMIATVLGFNVLVFGLGEILFPH